MAHVAVYGNLKWSILMKELLENEYSELLSENGNEKISVDYLVVDSPKSNGEISLDEFVSAYQTGTLQGIVIPKEYPMPYLDFVHKLLIKGVDTDDIYNGIRLNENIRSTPEFIPYLITPMIDDSYMSYLEYHVTDHCNLNCKYCTHYAPLVTEPVFTDFEAFKKDLTQLKKYIKDIGIIRILGGEPLLNPELPSFIEFTRQTYPGSIIWVVTNGMLLDRISTGLVDCMNKNTAFFHISYYPPFKDRRKDVEKFLVESKVPYVITDMIERFNKTQSLSQNEDPDFFYHCFQSTCTCLHEGKVAPCYAPFTTKYFNAAFDTDLPTDEGIDLYDEELTTQMLNMRLLIPLERCAYCIAGKAYTWEVLGRNSTLEDWIE